MNTLLFALLISQAPLPQQHPTDAIAPGAPIWSGSIDCSTSTTVFFEYDWDGAGGHSGYMLIPDGSIVTATNMDASNAATCAILGTPSALIGAQTGAGTRCDIDDVTPGPNGDTIGACIPMAAGQSVSFRVDWAALIKTGGARPTGVCTSAVSGRSRAAETISIYGTCVRDVECASQGGMGAGSTCTTSASTIESILRPRSNRAARGMYLGCRCNGTNRIDAVIYR